MASRSIIDRVLLLAAAVCAAGLVWQLTVLLTSKGKLSSAHPVEMASVAAPAPAPPPPVAAPAQPAPAVTPSVPDAAVRVVYPGLDTPKMTAKAGDPMTPTPTAPAVMASATPTPPAPSAAPATPPAAASLPADPPAAQVPASDPPAPLQVASAQPEADPAPAATPATAPAAPAPKPSGQAVDINTASAETLNRLHGGGHIGQAIVSHRPYKSVEDLVKRRVLRRDVFDRIRAQIAAQ